MKISRNFDSNEFSCSCCGRLIIDTKLVESLQHLRNVLGKPITISSGFRCADGNKFAGGSSGSLHLSGKAADITVLEISPEDVLPYVYDISDFNNGGIGFYPRLRNVAGFLHVDIRGYKARWGRINRIYTGIEEAISYGREFRKENGNKNGK